MTQQHNESEFVQHQPCPSCSSSDANGLYSDGHQYCFSCGTYTHADGVEVPTVQDSTGFTNRELVGNGEHRELTKRHISLDTCKKWNYQVGEFSGRPVQIANYYDPEGKRVVAQKIRFPNKDMIFLGNKKEAGLYGQWLWRDGGKMVVITEGELDALSVSQVQSNKWPVVSVPTGSKGAKKALSDQLEWLEKFDTVVLMFDMDEPGMEAMEECAPLFSVGKVKIARLPLKDANEMLQASRGSEIIDAIWGAKTWRPDGLVEVDDLLDELETPVERGLPWCFPALEEYTYGRRWGEIYGVGAGTGSGKTDFLTQQMGYDIETLGLHIGCLMLEQKPKETAKRAAGKLAGKRFHVPDGSWTTDELRAAASKLKGKMTMYDNFGSTDWTVVAQKIQYMNVAQGIRVFYLDHLTAMADTSNERESIEEIMKQMAMLANRLNIIIIFVSHLSTPEGKPHEEGGRVMIKHFKGSRSIGFWSFYLFGLERDQQAEDPTVQSTTTFRILKDRYTGQATGKTFHLGYDATTGLLFETSAPEAESSNPFKGRPADDNPNF
jgi:twinkle protein